MFNLEQSIAEWRKQMLATGIKAPAPLDELEIHLREEIERQTKSGLSEQEAFKIAVREIGQTKVLKAEFAKVDSTIHEWLKNFIFTLAGIPNYQLATNLNTSNQNIEPRWATYLKAATFVFPAVFFWLFSIVFLFPRLNEICLGAGTTPVKVFNEAPTIFRVTAEIVQSIISTMHDHWYFIVSAIILLFILLEWRFSKWPRYRRAVIGIGIFLINAAVFISITIMFISILIVAPALLYHAH